MMGYLSCVYQLKLVERGRASTAAADAESSPTYRKCERAQLKPMRIGNVEIGACLVFDGPVVTF